MSKTPQTATELKLETRIQKLLRVINLIGYPSCEHLYHPAGYRHQKGEPCPVQAEIIRLVQEAR
jgi:hypothetical protein